MQKVRVMSAEVPAIVGADPVISMNGHPDRGEMTLVIEDARNGRVTTVYLPTPAARDIGVGLVSIAAITEVKCQELGNKQANGVVSALRGKA